MNHADPWDEITRLEKQMEVELLAELERARAKHRKGIPVNGRMPSNRGLIEPQL
jgi:hypothetical protein